MFAKTIQLNMFYSNEMIIFMDFICEQINLPVKILELDFIERIIFIEEILLNNLNEYQNTVIIIQIKYFPLD